MEQRIKAGGISEEEMKNLIKAHEDYSKKVIQNTIDLEDLTR